MKFEDTHNILPTVLFVVGIAWTILGIRSLVQDLKFYSANNWNFDEESGVKMGTGYGYQGDQLSARQRFRYGHLLWIGVGLLFMFVPAISWFQHS